MPHNVDDSALVPKPPPPRPARRDAAIEAALQRFDGGEEVPGPAPVRPGPSWPSWIGRPQFALAMTACLIAVIGLPAAFIVMRDGNSPIFQASPPPPALESRQGSAAQNSVAVEAPPTQSEARPGSTAPPVTALVEDKQDSVAASAANKPADELAAAESPALESVAPPPPPPAAPPPPPPAAPMLAQRSVEDAVASGVVVTGSRIARPNSSAEREDRDVLNSLPANDAPTGGLSREAESVLSPGFRRCFGKDAPLNAESYDCLDREYHRLDRLLTSEYSAAMTRQSNEAARQRLTKDERQWLRTRFRHCRDEVGDLRGSTAAVVNESCEIDALAKRIVRLRNYGR